MERDQKIDSCRRKNEARSFFKKCFKNQIFSFVPFEVWRDLIVSNAYLESIALLSQTCHAFEELVGNIGENNLNLALMFRKEGQMILAKKYLLKCAENNNSRAILHLGFGFHGGWGFKRDPEKAAECFKKTAECGDFAAMALFASCLKNGFGVEKNEELSNLWAQKAVSSNNNYAIAYCHYIGAVAYEDSAKIFFHFEASAKEGDEFGQEMLGVCLQYGIGTNPDYEKSFNLVLQLAERGSCSSQYSVGEMYRDGTGVEKDLRKSVIWFKKAARQGNEDSLIDLEEVEMKLYEQSFACDNALRSRKNEARRLLKSCFGNNLLSLVPFEIWRDIASFTEINTITVLAQTCWGFKELVDNIGENNLNLALLFRKEGQIDLGLKHLLSCADNNNSRAMFYLGDAFFDSGWGLSKDEEKSAEWFKKSAEYGDFSAMAHFASHLCEGDGVERNEELGNIWAQKALSSKSPYAVGYCYYFGLGMDGEDDEKAISYFKASANEGDEFGKQMLAECLYDGIGIEENREEALKLSLDLAKRGSCCSQYRVGEMYRDGEGVEKDLEKAIFWFKKAARQGDDDSQEALSEIEMDGEGVI